MMYIQLFLSFLNIGLFSFGGGYAAMPLIQAQVVDVHHWLTMTEFTDLITISQMTPGPIAINSATFVGTRIAGIPGAVAATIGCILPSCVIVTCIARLYLKYRSMSLLQNILKTLRPAVVAMVAAAGISILITAFWDSDGSILLSNNQLASGRHLCIMRYSAPQIQNESYPGHGHRRCGKCDRTGIAFLTLSYSKKHWQTDYCPFASVLYLFSHIHVYGSE